MKKLLYLALTLLCLWLLGFLYFIYSISNFPTDLTSKADAVIVLTGGKSRIEEGLVILEKQQSPRMFISGVDSAAKLNEVLALHKHHNIYKPNIELGKSAFNTISNAQETKAWVVKNNIKSIILVTANYHMTRSLYEFKRILPDIKIIAYPVMRTSTWWQNPRMTFVLFKEYNKYLIWRLMSIA